MVNYKMELKMGIYIRRKKSGKGLKE